MFLAGFLPRAPLVVKRTSCGPREEPDTTSGDLRLYVSLGSGHWEGEDRKESARIEPGASSFVQMRGLLSDFFRLDRFGFNRITIRDCDAARFQCFGHFACKVDVQHAI